MTAGNDLAVDPDAATRLARALDGSPDLVLVASWDGRRIRANGAAARLLGIDGRAVDPDLLEHRAPPWARVRVRDHAVPALSATGQWEGELAVHDLEGDLVPLSVVAVAVRDAGGAVEEVVVVARDISPTAARQGDLERQATHDTLTGLPNRTLLLDRLSMALGRGLRRGSHVAVLYADLDGFKPVNDTLGHRAGDLLLAEVARRIDSAIRPGDTAARLGGDEFVVVCEDLTVREEAEAVIGRIAAEVARPVRVEGTEVQVTASIGLALAEPSSTPESLLAQADASMYEAKDRRSRDRAGPGPSPRPVP